MIQRSTLLLVRTVLLLLRYGALLIDVAHDQLHVAGRDLTVAVQIMRTAGICRNLTNTINVVDENQDVIRSYLAIAIHVQRWQRNIGNGVESHID